MMMRNENLRLLFSRSSTIGLSFECPRCFFISIHQHWYIQYGTNKLLLKGPLRVTGQCAHKQGGVLGNDAIATMPAYIVYYGLHNYNYNPKGIECDFKVNGE